MVRLETTLALLETALVARGFAVEQARELVADLSTDLAPALAALGMLGMPRTRRALDALKLDVDESA